MASWRDRDAARELARLKDDPELRERWDDFPPDRRCPARRAAAVVPASTQPFATAPCAPSPRCSRPRRSTRQTQRITTYALSAAASRLGRRARGVGRARAREGAAGRRQVRRSGSVATTPAPAGGRSRSRQRVERRPHERISARASGLLAQHRAPGRRAVYPQRQRYPSGGGPLRQRLRESLQSARLSPRIARLFHRLARSRRRGAALRTAAAQAEGVRLAEENGRAPRAS